MSDDRLLKAALTALVVVVVEGAAVQLVWAVPSVGVVWACFGAIGLGIVGGAVIGRIWVCGTRLVHGGR